jgi:hypothetical protein
MGSMKDTLGNRTFDEAHARRTDPGTSHEAARRVSAKLTKIQEDVLLLFRSRGSMTDLDLQKAFNFQGSTHRTGRAGRKGLTSGHGTPCLSGWIEPDRVGSHPTKIGPPVRAAQSREDTPNGRDDYYHETISLSAFGWRFSQAET